MLDPKHEITISTKHQSYLKILNANINDGETITWAVIRKAYKKQALIVHPDKGGSEGAFTELNTAFQKLEHLIENGTAFEFDGLVEMSSSLKEMFNELRAHLDRINEDRKRSFGELRSTLGTEFSVFHACLDRYHSTLNTNVFEIYYGLNKLNISVGELHASTQKLITALDRLSDAVDKRVASTKELHASIQAIDDQFNIDLPFYLGCYTAFLGSVVSAINSKHQPRNAHSVTALVFGAGLIATGGYLIANSLFKKGKPILSNENNEQLTESTLGNSTN